MTDTDDRYAKILKAFESDPEFDVPKVAAKREASTEDWMDDGITLKELMRLRAEDEAGVVAKPYGADSLAMEEHDILTMNDLLRIQKEEDGIVSKKFGGQSYKATEDMEDEVVVWWDSLAQWERDEISQGGTSPALAYADRTMQNQGHDPEYDYNINRVVQDSFFESKATEGEFKCPKCNFETDDDDAWSYHMQDHDESDIAVADFMKYEMESKASEESEDKIETDDKDDTDKIYDKLINETFKESTMSNQNENFKSDADDYGVADLNADRKGNTESSFWDKTITTDEEATILQEYNPEPNAKMGDYNVEAEKEVGAKDFPDSVTEAKKNDRFLASEDNEPYKPDIDKLHNDIQNWLDNPSVSQDEYTAHNLMKMIDDAGVYKVDSQYQQIFEQYEDLVDHDWRKQGESKANEDDRYQGYVKVDDMGEPIPDQKAEWDNMSGWELTPEEQRMMDTGIKVDSESKATEGDNIHWKEARDSGLPIIDKGRYYECDGKMVHWDGQEAWEAENFLKYNSIKGESKASEVGTWADIERDEGQSMSLLARNVWIQDHFNELSSEDFTRLADSVYQGESKASEDMASFWSPEKEAEQLKMHEVVHNFLDYAVPEAIEDGEFDNNYPTTQDIFYATSLGQQMSDIPEATSMDAIDQWMIKNKAGLNFTNESKANELTDIEKRKKRLAMQGDGSGMDGNSYGLDLEEPYSDLDESLATEDDGIFMDPDIGKLYNDANLSKIRNDIIKDEIFDSSKGHSEGDWKDGYHWQEDGEAQATEDDFKHEFDELSSLAQQKIEDTDVTPTQWDETPIPQREQLEDAIASDEEYDSMGDVWNCPECGFKTGFEEEINDHENSHVKEFTEDDISRPYDNLLDNFRS